ERIRCEDVQALLRLVTVRPDPALSARFPKEMPCRLRVTLDDGGEHRSENTHHEGFISRPMRWETVAAKFERLAAPYTDRESRRALVEAVAQLDSLTVRDLTALL